MARDLRAFPWDIVQAASEIQPFVGVKDLKDYVGDAMLRAAVERKLEIIGEAINQAQRYFPGTLSAISNWEQIVALRNRLIHGYSGISDPLIWEIVHTDVPVLLKQAQQLLDSGASSSS